MNLRNSASLAALCFAVAVGAFATGANAQDYDRVVVFGDSLSDNGNLPVGAPPPPYFGGRFSNGPTWVELLGFTLAHPGGNVNGSIDYAFGGARTDGQLSPPGMPVQLSMYTGAGGTFHGGDLVTVWGGANDIFQALPAASVSADPFGAMNTSGVTAANNISGLVNTIATGGAGTILVPNLPKLSFTPQFLSSPAAALADTGQNAFNARLLTNLRTQAAAHPNTNIILMDVYTLQVVATASPAAFGFTNVTQSCFNGVTVCSTPNTYFYWDGVHPTAAGHAMLAKLATESIYYGDLGVGAGAEGETAMAARANTYDASLGRLQARDFGDLGGGLSFTYERDDSTTEARGNMAETTGDSDTFRFNYEGNLSDGLRLGAMFSAGKSDVVTGPISFRAETVGFDGYAGWRSGDFFVNATGGMSFDSYKDIRRVTAINPVINEASTQGTTMGAKVQAGWYFGGGGVTISPRAAIGWTHNKVDGYAENGLIVKQMIDDRDIDATTGEVSLRIDVPFGDNWSAYAEGGYRDNLSYSGDPVTISLAGNTALPMSTTLEEPDGGLAMVDAGLKGRIGEHMEIGVGYRGRTGDNYESTAGAVTLKWRW